MGGFILLTMAIMHFLPKFTQVIPSGLAAIVTVTCGVEGVGIEGVVGDKLCVATLERETGDEDFRKFFHESMGSIGFGSY